MRSLFIIFIILLIAPIYSQDNSILNAAIIKYKSGENLTAKSLLVDYLNTTNDPKAHYYLGNVLMNLNEFSNAISHYETAIQGNYLVNDSLFNIACAYSLSNESDKSLITLFENYYFGDRNLNRIHSDPDLSIFRNSKYFEKYKIIISKLSNGSKPKSDSELVNALIHTGSSINPDPISSAGTFKFNQDKTFTFIEGNSYIGFWEAGIWDVKNGKLVLQHLGSIKPNESDSSKDYFFNNKKWVWNKKLITLTFSPFFVPLHEGKTHAILEINSIGDNPPNPWCGRFVL